MGKPESRLTPIGGAMAEAEQLIQRLRMADQNEYGPAVLANLSSANEHLDRLDYAIRSATISAATVWQRQQKQEAENAAKAGGV